MRIKDLAALSGNPATGQKLAIDTENGTFQIDYDALAAAIISKIGDPVALAHGGTGATSAGGARVGIGIKYAVYNSAADLGLTAPIASILAAFNAMPDNSILICDSAQISSNDLPTGGAAGIIEIVRKADSRAYVVFHGKGAKNHGVWRMFVGATSYNDNNANAPDGIWHPELAGCRGGTGTSGTTLAITLPSNSSHLLVMNGNGNNRLWVGILTVYSNGSTTATEIKKGTDATATTATNKVTITCSSGTELAFMCIPIRGRKFSDYTIS